jgi:plastocyanin
MASLCALVSSSRNSMPFQSTTLRLKEQNAMSDRRQTLHQALAVRGTRRLAVQAIAAAAGSLLLLEAATHQGSPLAFAQDDDDSSGRGRGRGRGRGGDEDNSGPGNAEDAGAPAEAAEEPAEAAAEVEPRAESLEVRIVGDDAGDFVPGELTVDLGQSVTFVNVHSDEHTATGSGFDTGIIPDEGGTATVALDTPGVFPYACQIHPEMTGVIRVRDENGVVPETQTTAQEVPADATMVVIANLAFEPAAITVPTGTTVAWTNDDAPPHTVTSTDGAFDSGILDPGGSFSFTFNEPGSFDYVCQLHPQMQGTVTAEGDVVASAPQASAAGGQTASSTPQAAAPSKGAVSIVDFSFEPATLDVAAGATVIWTNDGQAPHTVTGDFADSGILDPGQTFSHTFAESGVYTYACAIHPQMTGTVRVGAVAATEATPVAPSTLGAGPEGVWLIRLTPDDESILGPHQALATFHDDGTIEADFSPEPGDGAITAVLTSGRGEWTVNEAICRISLIALMNDGNQQFAGTATFDVEAELDTNGGAFDGTFDFEVVSAGGESNGNGSGTVRGGSVSLSP